MSRLTELLVPLEANQVKNFINTFASTKALQKEITGVLNNERFYTDEFNQNQLNQINLNLVRYMNLNIQEGVNHKGVLIAENYQKIAEKLDLQLPFGFRPLLNISNNMLIDQSFKDHFNEATNNFIQNRSIAQTDLNPVESPVSLSRLTSKIFPNDPTVANLDFSHLNRISENENGQNRGFQIGTGGNQNTPQTANGVLKQMSSKLVDASITYNHIDENVREDIIKPAFKHMLQELAKPDMSDDAKSQKLIMLEGLALSLGNCNTPVVDHFIQANLNLLPEEKRVISEENLETLVEKTTLKDRLRSELRKENLSFNYEAVEAMESLVSSIYKEDLPDNALKIDGGRKLPYSQSLFFSMGNQQINDAHKACLIKLVCKADENGEPLKNEAGNPILDPKKMATITSGARLSSGMENAQDVFAKKVSDFVMEKLNEEKYEPLMDLFYDPENYTNGNIPDVIKEKDQRDLFIEKCTEKGISDPEAVEAFFEEFKNDLQTKIDKELKIRKPEPSLQQEASLATSTGNNLSNFINPVNNQQSSNSQNSASSLANSNSPTQSPQRQRNNSSMTM